MVFGYLRRRWEKKSSNSFIRSLRKKGVTIGKNVYFYGDLQFINVDITRPSLVKIGNDVHIVSPFSIITHSWESSVFREKYHEFIGSAGKVSIGNNVYIGSDVMILKGSKIGDNVVIGARSLVNGDVPSDCVVAGIPARKIIDIDEFFEKRKTQEIKEAKEYALSIYDVFGRMPVEEDFFEFFTLFLKRDPQSIQEFNKKLKLKMKKEKRPVMTVQSQLGNAYEKFLKTESKYKSFEEFLTDVGFTKRKDK